MENIFPRVFLCDFVFQTLYILTLELSYLSYLLGSSFVRKIWFVVCWNHQELYPSICLWLCALPFKCKGGCALDCGYPSKCRGDWVCWYPSSVRWLCLSGFEPYPSFVRLIICLAKCHPSKCRGDWVGLCLASNEMLYWLREELCTPGLYLPKSSVEVPCVGSPVWTS